MAFIPLVDGCRAVIEYETLNAQWTINPWFYKLNFDETDQENLAAALDTWASSDLTDNLSGTTSYNKVTTYDMNSSGGRVIVDDTSSGAAGELATAGVALNVTACVTLRTNTRGRSGRGRMYISGLAESEVDERYIALQRRTDIENDIGDMKTAIEALGWTWIVASFQQDGVTLNPGVARPITSWEIRVASVASQRRRVPRA